MKIVKIILTVIIIIFIIVFIFMKKPGVKRIKKKEKIANITSLHYSYSTGTAINSSVSYDIKCKDECSIQIKPDRYSSEDVIEFTTSKDILKEIEEVLNNYNVITWDGFSKSDTNVLDGDSFSFIVRTATKNITASGYMMYPDNYSKVTNKIEEIINKVDPTEKKELSSLDEYKDLKLEDIKQVEVEENIEFNDEKKVFTDKDKIEYYYNMWSNIIVMNESKETYNVNRRIKFITNNKEYIINDSYDLLLLNDKWYYYKRK